MSTANLRQPHSIAGTLDHGVAIYRLAHGDLTDADTSQTITLSDLALAPPERAIPAKSFVCNAWINVLTAFAGGGNTAVVIKLGDAADDDELITDVSIFTGTGVKPKTGTYTLGTYEAAYAPKVVVTTTDGTCAGLTAGLLEIFIEYKAIQTEAHTR